MSGEGLTFTGINLGSGAAPPPPGPVPAGPVPASPSGSPYDDLINQAAQENDLNPVIFRAQLMQESKLQPDLVNPASGASGIAQFMPATARAFGIDPMNPQQAIPGAARYMRQLLNANNEDYPSALAAYNWGPGNLKRHGFAKAPPETRKYISNILGPDSGSPIVVGATPSAPPPVKSPAGGTAGAMAMAPAAQALTFTGINLGPDQGSAPPQKLVLSPLTLSKGATREGVLPDNRTGLDPAAAGDAWSTNEISEGGIPKHYVLPTKPGDRPPSGDGIFLGDAAQRYRKTGQFYGPGPFDTDERGAEYMRTHQQPSQPPPGGGMTFTGINLGPASPQQEAPSWYNQGDFPGALTQGISDAAREAMQTASGQAFTDQPQQTQPPNSFVGGALYGLGHSAPMIGAGLAGMFGGGAVGGPIGATAGGALGFGAAGAFQALAPGYAQGRQQGMEHEQAMDYAIRRAATEGLIGAATAPLFELSPFRSAVGKMLFQTFVTQPGVGAGTRVVEPLVTGDKQPTLSELARGAGQDILAGAAFNAGHAVVNRVLPKAAPPPPDASGLRQLIENMRGQPQQQQQAEPGPPVPAAAVLQHAQTRMAALKDATTPEEITEREFLTKNANNPEALAQSYGVSIAPDAAQGEAAREPVPAAALPEAAAPAVSSENVVPPDQFAGHPQPARSVGDAGGDTRIAARAAGEGIPRAEAVRTDGNVQPVPGEEGVAAGNVLARREPTPEEEASIRQNIAARTQELSDAQAAVQERTAAMTSGARAAGELQDQARPHTNEIHENPTVIGKPNAARGDHVAEKGFTYRSLSEKELAHIQETGEVLPPPGGKSKGGRMNTKHWSRADGRLYYRPDQEVIRVKNDAITRDTPVRIDQVEVWNKKTNQFEPLAERAAEVPVGPAEAVAPRGELVTEAKPETSTPQPQRLRVSRQLPDGTIKVGEPGQIHAELYSDQELRNLQPGQYEKETGFVTPDGQHLNRQEASAWVDRNQPGVNAKIAEIKAQRGRPDQGDDGLMMEPYRLASDITEQERAAAPTLQGEKSRELNSGVKSQSTAASELGQAPGQAEGQALGQAERPGQVGQAESSLSPETLQDKNLDLRPVTSTPEDASAPEQDQVFHDEQPASPAAGEIPEEAPIDVKTAKRPQDQLRLNALNTQLEKLQSQPGDHADQIAKLTATRDKLVPQDLLARRVGKQPSKVSTAPPKPLGAEKDFLDYKFQDGTPVYRDAFVEHAMRKLGMPQAGAEAWANRAINLPIHEQVEILRTQVQDKFGFADVKIDDKFSAYDATHFLLDFHRAAQDMMTALGFPVDMASLMGKARLELQPFVEGKTPFGSYAPSTKTITVHGRANVFGHEWIHAFDHEIADHLLQAQQNPGYLATQMGRAGVLNPANPIALRIGHLINTLFHDQAALALRRIALQIKAAEVNKAGTPTLAATKAQIALKALETGTGVKGLKIKPSEYRTQSASYGPPSYWANEAELLARAGEAYLARIMEQRGLDPGGVLLPDEAYLSDTDQRLRMTFPKQQERADIFAAYEHLMDGYRQTALAGSPAAVQAMRGGMSDPKVWGKMFRDPNQMGPFKELVHRVRNKNDTLANAALTDPSRPDPGGNHAFQRAKAGASAIFNSRMGVLEGLYEMVPQAAKAPLQKVMDRLGYTPGKGRYTGWDTIEEEANGLLGIALNQMTNAMQRAGLKLDRFTKEQGDHLRHTMTTGESTYPTDPLDINSARVPIDPAVDRAAGPLRVISNDFFDMLKKAGFDIGHSKNGHFMRIYDQVRIHSDPLGFTKAAGELYGRMFDDDVGAPGDKPDALREQWMAISEEERKNADPAVQTGMTALGKNLRRQKEVENDMAANGVTAAKQAEYDQLQLDAEQLALAHHDAVKGQYSELGANDWLDRVRKHYAQDFDRTGPGGNFLNKRTLPTYTDQVMRDYMITDPMTVLPRYYESAARKIAYAKRFGVKGEIRDKLIDEMLKGGMHPDDVRNVGKIIDQASGRTSNSYSQTMTKAANIVHASAALGLLGRSAYSTLAEPFVIALSHGSMRAGLRTFGAVFGNIMRTASAYERAEVADLIGIVRSKIHEDILMNRTGADYSDSPLIGKFMAQYYRTIGLTQMTNWNRQAAVAGGDWLLGKYARDILNPSQRAWASDRRDNAKRMLNELGVAPELHEEFAKWKHSLGGMPDTDTIGAHRFGPSYARAMRRIIDRSVIDPKKIERPMATGDKWIGLLWQFQSFNYGFQRNVIDPMVKRIEHAYAQGSARGGGGLDSMARGGVNAAWEINHTGAIVGAYVGINMLTTMLRQYVFNKDDWDKHEADGTLSEYITDLAMQRSGLGGTLDPITQVVTNLRYTQDLSGLLEGPGVKFMAKNFYDVLMGIPGLIQGQPEDQTNTRAHSAVKGLYNLIGLPVEAFLATKLSAFGSLANIAAGGGYQYLSSPQSAEDAATAVTGPKGAKLPEHKGGLPELPKLSGLPKLPKLPKPGQQPDKAQGSSSGAGAGTVPWGLMDDFIAPAWKVTKPFISVVPGWMKATAAAGGVGYGAVNFWNRMEPYRNAPPPKQKETAR